MVADKDALIKQLTEEIRQLKERIKELQGIIKSVRSGM